MEMSDTPKSDQLFTEMDRLVIQRKSPLDMRDEMRKVERKLNNIRKEAQAVVDRWDTPVWKDVPATAEYINALRRALEETK